MPEGIRLLSAVMFTDLVGFTALMQENEAKAKEIRDIHRKVIDELIPANLGKTLQYFGDGTLSIFGSAINAVTCAVDIQKALRKDITIPLRIGIHMGDIVYDDEGVYGDSVNIASRIESMSVPGSVLISEKIYDEIKNHQNLPAESIGLFELKNVKHPIEIFAVRSEGLVIPAPMEMQGKGTQLVKSIAVLPFVNMSSEQENEYFSDGITEEIINSIAKVEGLQVTSRTSSFAFKGRLQDIRGIGDTLGVSVLLEGSVRKAGNRVRITAQLINVKDGFHSWSEVYDMELKDIFEVQDSIAMKIRDRLVENLHKDTQIDKLVKPPTANLQAYNLFLKGRYYYNKYTPDNFRKAFKLYEEASGLDPGFSMAYSGMARCYVTLGGFSQLEPVAAFTAARKYAEKAIELDKTNNSAYLDLAMVEMFYCWNWVSADKYFKKAQELNHNSSDLYFSLTIYENIKGNFAAALDYAREAYRIDPLSLMNISQLAECYMYNYKYDKAEEYFLKVLDMDPGFRSAINNYARLKCLQGRLDEAVEMAEKMHAQLSDKLKGVTELGTVYAMAGMIPKAMECIERLKERQERDKDMLFTIDYAFLYAFMGDYEKAFYYFNKALEERHASVLFIKMLPLNKSELTEHPEYIKLVKRLKLD